MAGNAFNKILPSSNGVGCYIYMARAAGTRLKIFLLLRMDLLGEACMLCIWGLAQPASQSQIIHKAMHRHATYSLPAA